MAQINEECRMIVLHLCNPLFQPLTCATSKNILASFNKQKEAPG
uniref:Uncharacterized protein n=1 Tax=Anguilla anguilla TaxID=7936 RepID=A0A0E9Q6L5_ANGAN